MTSPGRPAQADGAPGRLATSLAGVPVSNPVWIGSSELTMTPQGLRACLESGAGAVVAKSVNENPAASRQLDIADYAFLDDQWSPVPVDRAGAGAALLNRSGLVQRSLDDWLEVLAEARAVGEANDTLLIGSITIGEVGAAREIVRALSSVTSHVEVNVGAPHAREARSGAVTALSSAATVEDLVRSTRDVCEGLLLLKLPDAGVLTPSLVEAGRSAGADAVVLTGRQHGFMPDIQTFEPVLGSWGAYSSPRTLPMSLYAVSKAYRQSAGTLPLVGTNGARDAADVLRFLLSGARAVELVTAVWTQGPAYVGQVVRDLDALLDRSPASTVEEVVGASVGRAREYGDIAPVRPPARPWSRWLESGDDGEHERARTRA